MITCNCSASERDRICLFAGRALPKSINIARGDCPFLRVRRTLPGLTSLCAYGGSRLCIFFNPAQSCSVIFLMCAMTQCSWWISKYDINAHVKILLHNNSASRSECIELTRKLYIISIHLSKYLKNICGRKEFLFSFHSSGVVQQGSIQVNRE